MNKKNILSGKDFYNQNESVAHYSESTELFPKEIVAFSFLPENAVMLDLGCGAGRTTTHFKRKGYTVIGADIAFNMVNQAANLYPDIPFVTADAINLPYKNQVFDVVVFSLNGLDCIYPYEDRVRALQSIKQVLKPGGLFIFSAHNHCFPRDWAGVRPFVSQLFKKQRNCYMSSYAESGGFNLYLTSPEIQIQELQELGFRTIDIVPRKILRSFKQFKKLIGFVDNWIYYICEVVD